MKENLIGKKSDPYEKGGEKKEKVCNFSKYHSNQKAKILSWSHNDKLLNWMRTQVVRWQGSSHV